MKAILVVVLFYANGLVERSEPLIIETFQQCLDIGVDVMRRPFTLEQKKAGLVNVAFECEPTVARA